MNGIGRAKRALDYSEDTVSKEARNETPDSPLRSPTLSPDEKMAEKIEEPPTHNVIKLRLNFLDSVSNPKMLRDWQWTILTNLLEEASARGGILHLSREALTCFRVNNRIHFARLAAFLNLIRDSLCPKRLNRWTHLDPTHFTPEERAVAVAHDDFPLWRPALLSFVEGDVTIKSGRYTAIGFRNILKRCPVFETILGNHPDEPVLQMEGIEPFLLSTAYVWSYCKPFTGMMNGIKTEQPVPPPKDPAAFIAKPPEWLQEATDATWWQHFFSLYKPERVLDSIPIAAKHPWPAIRSGCEKWVNGLVAKLLADFATPGKKIELEPTLYKAARAATQLDAIPNNHFTLDRIRLWCPNLATLRLQLSEPLPNRNAKTFHFPRLLQLDLHIVILNSQKPAFSEPTLFLDCLAGCPLLEKLKIEAISSPMLLGRLHKSPINPFLPELRTLELSHLYLGGPSDNTGQRLFSNMCGMPKLEELTLNNIVGLTADDIRQLAPLKELRVLKIIFDIPCSFTDDMIEAVAELKSLEHVELDSLSDEHYDLFARLSENKK